MEGLSGSGNAIFLAEAISIAGLAGVGVVDGLAGDGDVSFSPGGTALGEEVSG